jgi:hypothetical protein
MKVMQMRNSSNSQGILDLTQEFPNNTVMAEIGSYAGESTELFFKSGRVIQLYASDPWQEGYDDTVSAPNTDFMLVENAFDIRMKNKNVIKLKMTMKEAFNLLPELDVVYIDGNHAYEYVLSDIQLSLKKIKNGGIICGHDYNKTDAGVMQAVNEIFGKPNKVFSDTSWMVKINKNE